MLIALLSFLPRLLRKELQFGSDVGSLAPGLPGRHVPGFMFIPGWIQGFQRHSLPHFFLALGWLSSPLWLPGNLHPEATGVGSRPSPGEEAGTFAPACLISCTCVRA